MIEVRFERSEEVGTTIEAIAVSIPGGVSDNFVPCAGEVQANVSPTAAARLDTLNVVSAPCHESRKSDTDLSLVLVTLSLCHKLDENCCKARDEAG